jgi:hypothetical protein
MFNREQLGTVALTLDKMAHFVESLNGLQQQGRRCNMPRNHLEGK